MKITGIRSYAYLYDSERPMGDANFPEGRKRWSALAVFIDTDEGLSGVCIGSAAAQAQVQTLGKLLEGEDPRAVRGLWQRMNDYAFKIGTLGIMGLAISVLDTALWDLKARIAGEPLWRTLGASEPRVRAYASGIDICLGDDELHAYYREMAGRGINVGKMKGGIDQADDIRRLGIMRDALSVSGSRPGLALDVNEYWYPKQAIRRIKEIEQEFDLLWVEEPARRWDYSGLHAVSRAITAAVASGENLAALGEFRPLVEHASVDILQIGSPFVGGALGITGALQAADLAAAFELPVTMVFCPGNYMAHLGAALPNCLMAEVVGGIEPCFRYDNKIENGWIVLGDSPGIGIEFDEEKLASLTIPPTESSGAVMPGRGSKDGDW
jgi:L-alanine-DL-glutamate epimerase-like enolase superfamily enzyme